MAKKVVKKKAVARQVTPVKRSNSSRTSGVKKVVISPVTLLIAGAVLAVAVLWAYSSMVKSDISDPQTMYKSSESVDLE